MSTADIDRIFSVERLRKSRRRWRIFGVVAILAAIAAGLIWQSLERPFMGNQIARLRVDGLITGDEKTLELVRRAGASDNVKALIIRIDSPGGTTAGSEALYEEIRKAAAKKPVVAVMDSVAASGGYITAIAADHIVARGNTITGSIGVIFSYPEVSKLLDTIGVKMEEIKSGELKAEPTPYKPLTERVRAVSNEMVQDSFNWFVGLVAERRKLSDQQARILADGRAYTGRQAAKIGLVDKVGGETEAVAWLETDKKIEKDLKIVDWAPRGGLDPTGLGFSMGDGLIRAFGLESVRQVAERAKLDGLLVLWHP
jgi:protease-4